MKRLLQTSSIALGLIITLTAIALMLANLPFRGNLQPVHAFSQGSLALPTSRSTPQPTPEAVTTESDTLDAALIEEGRALVIALGCTGCHGAQLSGGPMPLPIPGRRVHPANLTPDVETGLGTWTQHDFARVFREGTRPNGEVISGTMPWQSLGRQLTDDNLEALWTYLQSIPALPYGNH